MQKKKKVFEVSSRLFDSKHTVKNDRYALYRMLYHYVTFNELVTQKEVAGFVSSIYRDVFANQIIITISDKPYRFEEPDTIKGYTNDVVFVYGNVDPEISDEKLFDEMRKEQFRETVNDTVSRLTKTIKGRIRFKVGNKKPSRRRPLLLKKRKIV